MTWDALGIERKKARGSLSRGAMTFADLVFFVIFGWMFFLSGVLDFDVGCIFGLCGSLRFYTSVFITGDDHDNINFGLKTHMLRFSFTLAAYL